MRLRSLLEREGLLRRASEEPWPPDIATWSPDRILDWRFDNDFRLTPEQNQYLIDLGQKAKRREKEEKEAKEDLLAQRVFKLASGHPSVLALLVEEDRERKKSYSDARSSVFFLPEMGFPLKRGKKPGAWSDKEALARIDLLIAMRLIGDSADYLKVLPKMRSIKKTFPDMMEAYEKDRGALRERVRALYWPKQKPKLTWPGSW